MAVTAQTVVGVLSGAKAAGHVVMPSAGTLSPPSSQLERATWSVSRGTEQVAGVVGVTTAVYDLAKIEAPRLLQNASLPLAVAATSGEVLHYATQGKYAEAAGVSAKFAAGLAAMPGCAAMSAAPAAATGPFAPVTEFALTAACMYTTGKLAEAAATGLGHTVEDLVGKKQQLTGNPRPEIAAPPVAAQNPVAPQNKGPDIVVQGMGSRQRQKIYFNFDSAELSAESSAALQQEGQRLAGEHIPKVKIDGYTDLAGGEAYNQQLSSRRAESVSKGLQAGGYRGTIVVEAHGAADPVVNTPKPEPLNRRAIVSVP